MKSIKLLIMAAVTTITSSCSGQDCCSGDAKKITDSSNSKAVAVCDHCGKASCDKTCSSNPKGLTVKNQTNLKNSLPSCSLSESQLLDRKTFLQSGLAGKIKAVKEMPTGYDLVFTEPKEYSAELLAFINFEKGCCSSFTYSLIFEPNNKATHLQIYGSKQIKTELSKGFKELRLIK